MTGCRLNSNSKGVYFTEMDREPDRQDTKPWVTVIIEQVAGTRSAEKKSILPADELRSKILLRWVNTGNGVFCILNTSIKKKGAKPLF